MEALILGGTQFIGRHIAEMLLTAGHTVSTLNRGKSPDELPAEIERLRGDRDQGVLGLESLKGRSWDVCVDMCGYTPTQVRASADLLRGSVKRYVFMSAVSVYGDPALRPVYETHPRLPPAGEDLTEIDADTYGPLKVGCEDIVQQDYGDRCTVLRPQVVVGVHDQKGRQSYWVQRAMQETEMLAPGDGSDHLQVIDVRDVARFVRTVIEHDVSGVFNLAGPRFSWREFMRILGAQNIVWVDAEIIKAAGLTHEELPLFRAERGVRSGLMDVSNERARANGLTLTKSEVTVGEMQAYFGGKSFVPALSPERETELIRISRRTHVRLA